MREGLTDVIKIADQSDLTVQDNSNTLASACKTSSGAVLGLQIQQAVNN